MLEHPEWYSKAYRLTHAPLLRIQLRRAKLLFAVSEPIATQIARYASDKQRVLVVPNAPAQVFLMDRSDSEVSETLTRHSLTPGSYVLSVGSLDPRKNLERVSAAFSRLERSGLELVLVGGSSRVFREATPGEGVRVLGYVTDEELSCLYLGSAFVAFPSLDEGFGLPAIEALASGARVLVSDNPVMRWVCEEHATYVDPYSTTDITREMASLLAATDSDEDRATRRAYGRRRFSWDASAKVLRGALE